MFRYVDRTRPGTAAVDNSVNGLLLRSDIHTIFDQKRFVIVPKNDSLVVHIVAPGPTSELIRLYHNVELQPLSGMSIECFLARFAWTVFVQVMDFVLQEQERLLVIYEDGKIVSKVYSGKECTKEFGPQPKSRSQSPRKRQRDGSAYTEPAVDLDELDTGFYEEDRGRRRKRSSATSLSSGSHEGWQSFCQRSTSTSDTSDIVEKSSVVVSRKRRRLPCTEMLEKSG